MLSIFFINHVLAPIKFSTKVFLMLSSKFFFHALGVCDVMLKLFIIPHPLGNPANSHLKWSELDPHRKK